MCTRMKKWAKAVLLLLCCVSGGKAVTIESCPQAAGQLIQTAVEETVTLTCINVESFNPSGLKELQWYRNDALVELSEANRLNRSSLCVQPVTRDDHRVIYKCQLKGEKSINSSIQLNVRFPPNINGTEDVSAEETSDLTLVCDVQANPAVAVAWNKDGEILDLTSGSYKTTNNGISSQLTIRKLKRDEHQGTYVCETTSPVHGVRSKAFIITVEDKVLKFPVGPTIAGVVVVLCTVLFAMIARRDKIQKCFRKHH